MKPISNDFKTALKNIKQIDAIISYADRENTNFIITQNSNFLMTEASDYLVTESAEVVIDNGGIQNCAVYWNTDIFKSTCKMLDLEVSSAIPKGTELNLRVGLKVGNSYEYVDYGKFYTIEESTYQFDTGTYTTTAYDKMINFNISAIENPLTFETGVTYTLEQYLKMICNKCNVAYAFDFSNVINSDKAVIDKNYYDSNKEVTYRDIIDDIAECLGTNFLIDANNKITNKEILMTSQITIDADILRDTNVNIGEKKNAIDGLEIYEGSTMINYVGDNTYVFKIKNNNIMSANSTTLMSGVLSMIADFEYYAYNLETFGVLALDPFDCFTVTYNNTNYLLCSFHNDIKITGGITEEISYEFNDEDNVAQFKTSSNDDALKDASIEIDKAAGQIVLKANSNGNIVQAELKADASTGSAFNVKADNINFNGKTFNLTADNMAISSTNFSVDSSGNMTANSGTFGGSINTAQNCTVGNNLYVGQNQSTSAVDSKYIYLNENNYIRRSKSGSTDFIEVTSAQKSALRVGDNQIYIMSNYARMQIENGDYIYVSPGSLHSSSTIYNDSDKRLKDKIKDIEVSWIDDLKIKEFEYKNNKGKKEIGLIAQDYIDKEYSNYFLGKNDKGYYCIQYGNITNALIQYCQELKKEVKELKQEVEVLKNEK